MIRRLVDIFSFGDYTLHIFNDLSTPLQYLRLLCTATPLQFSGVTSMKEIPADIVRYHDAIAEEEETASSGKDLASKFMFFATFEDRKKEEDATRKKVFRMTPPRDGVENQVPDSPLLAPTAKRCMAVNCAVCRLRVNCACVCAS